MTEIGEYKTYKNGFEANLHAKVIDFLNSMPNKQAVIIKRKNGMEIGIVKIRKTNLLYD